MFPKKIKACILFLLLTVPAALGAVWCAKHAYRYHLAVHPLPYSPEQGALLEKHRQDKRNARLNPHAPVLFLGSSTMEFWLKEGKHSWETWFSPLGCLNLGTRSETTGNLLWRLNDGLTSPLALLAIGAGFKGRKALGYLRPTAVATAVKLMALPALFLPVAVHLGFTDEKLVALLVMLGSIATPSCYVMAKQMGHEGVLTGSVCVTTTLFSAFSLTFWLFLLRSMGCIA